MCVALWLQFPRARADFCLAIEVHFYCNLSAAKAKLECIAICVVLCMRGRARYLINLKNKIHQTINIIWSEERYSTREQHLFICHSSGGHSGSAEILFDFKYLTRDVEELLTMVRPLELNYKKN